MPLKCGFCVGSEPFEASLEPIFNRLAEDREHVKVSKMPGPKFEWTHLKDSQRESLYGLVLEWFRHLKCCWRFSYVLRHAAHKLDVRIRKAPLTCFAFQDVQDGFVRLKDIMELKNFRPYSLEDDRFE